jgi:hypothetical protein
VTEGVKSLQGIGRVLDPRLDLLGSAQMAVSEVDTFQRFLDLLHGGLERVIAGDNFLAVAVRSSDFVALAPPSFTVAEGDLRQLVAGFLFRGDRTVGPLLKPSSHLIQLVERMETIIALLGLREDLTDPGFNALGRIFHYHR